MLVDALIILALIIALVFGASMLLAFILMCGAGGRLLARRLWPVSPDVEQQAPATGSVQRR